MSKTETDLPERLQAVGASPLEQRLLRAAGSEVPSVELSERMARAIGVSLPAAGLPATGGGAKGGAAAKAASGSTLVPWLSGALVAAVATGAFLTTRPTSGPSRAAPTAAAVQSAPQLTSPSTASAPAIVTPLTNAPATAEDEAAARALAPSASPRSRGATTANELANQIARVDAARAALANGGAARALAGVRDYQAEYPNGAFKPEAAAIKIEALIALGRKSEARALAERFTATYGSGPLADRVARLVGVAQR